MKHRKIRTSLDPYTEAPALEPAPAPRGAPLAPSARFEATGAAPEPFAGVLWALASASAARVLRNGAKVAARRRDPSESRRSETIDRGSEKRTCASVYFDPFLPSRKGDNERRRKR
jgi:hypothetical protein